MRRHTTIRLMTITLCSGIGLYLLPLSLNAHQRCDLCHLSPSPTQQQADLAGSLPGLCIDCHAERAGNGEHIINVAPTGVIGNLPLVNGKLGCTTCHDPHGTTPMQLRSSANDLCMSCHPR